MTDSSPDTDLGAVEAGGTSAAPAETGAPVTGQVPGAPIPPELAAALVGAWAELGTLTKDKTAKIEAREGKRGYEYSYADLASLLELVRPVLARHGLALLQPIQRHGNGPVVIETWLLHTSGHMLWWTFEVAASGGPQQIGSAVTYGRRYSAQAALGVAAEDDDGAAAQSAATKTAPRKVAPRRPQPARSPREAKTRRAMALFSDLGLGEREARLAETSAILGIEVASWSDLDEDQVDIVLGHLEHEIQPPDPDDGEGYGDG